MIRSVRIISFILLLAGLILLDVHSLEKSALFSELYPLNRVHLGNLVTVAIDWDSLIKYKSRIIKVNNEDMGLRNFGNILTGYKKGNELKFTLEKDGTTDIAENKGNNSGYFFFLIFIALFGNIHFIWGGTVFMVRLKEPRARLFSINAIALSLFYFIMIEEFTFGRLSLLMVFTVLFLGFLNVLFVNNLTNHDNSKLLLCSLSAIAGIILVSSFILIIDSGSIGPAIYAALFIYLLMCYFFSFFRLFNDFFKEAYPFVRQRNFVLIVSFVAGNAVPLLSILSSAFIDLRLPIPLLSVSGLLFPLIMGNAVLKYNQYDLSRFKIFQLDDLKIFIYNLFIVFISAILLYSFFPASDPTYNKILYMATSVFIIILLFDSQLFLIRSLDNHVYENEDNYAFSAQKIAELSSSSESIEYKLKNIYREITGLTGGGTFKLIFFRDTVDDYFSRLSNYLEVLPEKSDICSLFKMNRDVILKQSLSRNSAFESGIYNYLDRKKSIFIIPVFDRDEIKGALLIGERKRKGFYLEADIHFFHTIMHQLLQLVESDMLYKDYILKKQYEQDLDNASYVQMRLFPKVALEGRGLYITFFYRPYLRVIGDYFDFFKVDEDRTAVIIGDVSGHGLSTAMVLSAVNNITHIMLHEGKTFGQTFAEINNYLNRTYKGIELITLFIGIFNRKTKKMEYINAGHWAPLLVRRRGKKKIQEFRDRSKILGADPDAEYAASSISLKKDDELILYTDGVMEIYNEETGLGLNQQKFFEIIHDSIKKDIDGKLIEIEKNIKIHSKGIKDDITIIGVKIY